MRKAAVLLLILSTWTSSSFAEALKLNGIAEFNRLRTTFYIAALYLETPNNNPESILRSTEKSRMEMRIVTNKWRSRSFSSYILGQIAINNSGADLSRYTSENGALTRLVETTKDEPIIVGDTIAVEFNGSRSVLLLNNETIAVEKGKTLFNAMLNLWIGKRPPSRQFKEDILEKADDGLVQDTLDLFLLLSPTAHRQAYASSKAIRVKNYRSLTTEHAQFIKDAAQANASFQAAEVASTKANQQALQAETAQIKATQEAKQQALALKKARQAAKIKQDDAAQQALEKQKIMTEKAEKEATRLLALEKAAEQKRLDRANELETQRKTSKTAKIIAQKKAEYDYKAHIRSQIYKYVEYPARAHNLGQEGTAVISVTIENNGKISTSSIHTSSKYKALDKAALKSAKKVKSKAFSTIMSPEPLTFLMRVTFRKK